MVYTKVWEQLRLFQFTSFQTPVPDPPEPGEFPEVDSPFLINTSASEDYNAAGIPDNFDDPGDKWDKSHNYQASNVSSASVNALLYPGNITKVFAVTQPWWGLSSHIDNGTTSNDTTQQQKQVADMKRRGFAGVIPSWYGHDNHGASSNGTTINAAVLKTVAQCNSQGMLFCLMFVKLPTSPTVDPPAVTSTQDMLNTLTYANANYFNQPSYLKIDGRPVFVVFDEYSGTNWTTVRTHAATLSEGNPWFLFRNASGFSHAQSDGAFSWIGANQPPGDTTDYLDSFYAAGLSSGGKKYFGSFYKGMDQTLASWSEGRFIEQLNGQTFLDTAGRIAAAGFSTSQQLKYALVPWDDYEEGTEIETGISNGIEITASESGGDLEWTIDSGNENAVENYAILSTPDDGTTFYRLGTVAVGVTSFPIPTLEAGTHKLYVVAQGKCSFVTVVSNEVEVEV